MSECLLYTQITQYDLGSGNITKHAIAIPFLSQKVFDTNIVKHVVGNLGSFYYRIYCPLLLGHYFLTYTYSTYEQ